MRLCEVRREVASGRVKLIGRFESAGSGGEIYYSFPEEVEHAVVERAEPFLGPLLIPALLRGEPLEIDPPTSPMVADGLARARDLFCQWYPQAHRGEIVTRIEPSKHEAAEGVGAFASGGVDSFYTILRERSRITHLVHMHGASQRPDDPSRAGAFAGNEARAYQVGEQLDLPVVVGETNVRTVFDLNWGYHYNGSALAGMLLALSGAHSLFFVPSSFAYTELYPWGSHPLLDEAFSAEDVRIIHHGCEATRAEKTAWLAEHHPEILPLLHVCVGETVGHVNCGRCPKCVRSMVALQAVGALEHAGAFPRQLPDDVESRVMRDAPVFVKANYELALRTGRDPKLVRTLARCVDRMKRRDAIRMYAEHSPLLRPALESRRRRIKAARAAADRG